MVRNMTNTSDWDGYQDFGTIHLFSSLFKQRAAPGSSFLFKLLTVRL